MPFTPPRLSEGPLGEVLRELVSLCISPPASSIHSILSDRIQSYIITRCVKSEITYTAPGIIALALILITLMRSFMQRPGHDVSVKISRWCPYMRILVNNRSCAAVVSRERRESSLWKITNDLKPSGNGTAVRGSGRPTVWRREKPHENIPINCNNSACVTVGGGSGGVAGGAEAVISGG